jgi:hypothetical protein
MPALHPFFQLPTALYSYVLKSYPVTFRCDFSDGKHLTIFVIFSTNISVDHRNSTYSLQELFTNTASWKLAAV